jgi:uncharacterized membrane protein YcaP (DUF421 family)
VEAVLHSTAIYLFLLVVIRATGKRTLAQVTTFDFVLLLIIGEAAGPVLLGEDISLTRAFTVILTLVVLNLCLAWLKQRSPRLEQIIDGMPLVLVEEGRPLRERMDRVRVDEFDILQAARETQGLERMEQIRYAVLERSGGISIIPRPPEPPGQSDR